MIKAKIPDNLKKMSREQLQFFVNEYYRTHFQGGSVINQETQFVISFNAKGRNETANAAKRKEQVMTAEKATAIMYLKELMASAQYKGFAKPKDSHVEKHRAIVLFMFKSEIYIDGVKKAYKLTCILNKGGKFHYAFSNAKSDF